MDELHDPQPKNMFIIYSGIWVYDVMHIVWWVHPIGSTLGGMLGNNHVLAIKCLNLFMFNVKHQRNSSLTICLQAIYQNQKG